MTTVAQPLPIDAKGNILVHGRSGCMFEVDFGVDVSSRPLFFEVRNKFRVPLQPGSTPTKRLLALPQALIAELGSNPAGILFAFSDDSPVDALGNVIPYVFWEGSIIPRGFAQQPPPG